MQFIQTILIDDEPSSLQVLTQRINKHCPEVNILEACDTPVLGIQAIEKYHPQLVFLDIEMPGMNGFTMLQKLSYRNFQLVFVTAYDHYAIKAIKFSALDYLLKPVDVEELKNCIARVAQKMQFEPAYGAQVDFLLESLGVSKRNFKKIALPTLEGLQFVRVEDIVYLEAKQNYTSFHLAGGNKLTISRTLREFEELLPREDFIRIHNSYIIHKDYVEKYIRGEGGQVILSGNITLDVSKRKKHDFLVAIGKL